MNTVVTELTNFWDLVLEVWNEGLYGIPVAHFGLAIFILLVALAIRQLFAKFALAALKRLVRRTKTEIDDQAVELLEGPVKFIPVIIGVFFAGVALPIPEDQMVYIHNITRSLITYLFFWAAYNMIQPMCLAMGRVGRIFTPIMIDWIGKFLRVLTVVVGGAAILWIWSIPVAGVVASFGLLGVAVALGAQDLFKNLIAGIMILLERRFQRGDWIRVDGVVEGTVETIGFRSTAVRRFDKALVQVPNTSLSDNAVTNFTRMTHRRIYWKIGVTYSTSAEQLAQVCREIRTFLEEDPDFAPRSEVATFVFVDSFNASSIDILLYCFTRTTIWGEWLSIKEKLAFKIKEIVEGAGTSFAFPSTSIYLETLPEGVPGAGAGGPEPFTPPTEQKAIGQSAGGQTASGKTADQLAVTGSLG